jgi:hypothetical protein
VSEHKYIELDRKFFKLSDVYTQNADNDDLELSQALGLNAGAEIGWDAMLEKQRVIILSEAGSGKTEEIKQAAIRLENAEKPAFFLRLENIPDGLEDAFEVGDLQKFEGWLASDQQAWLLLDSVDESRLRDPKDFQKAIKAISKKIQPALHRTHIIITSRANAWRAKTDLDLCKKFFPLNNSKKKGSVLEQSPEPEDESQDENSSYISSAEFEFYALSDLSEEQIKKFLQANGVAEVPKILQEIERHDAQIYTARPQDLQELAEYWIDNKKIGSRLDLMRNSIQRRLNERDQDRDDAKPLSFVEAYEGIKNIAAASTLMHQQNIKVPDGSNNNFGFDTKLVLPDWDSTKLVTLLGRPVFDEGPYGGVMRFHHRSVREFLTAEWFSELLINGASRSKIESLFFKEQYGLQVIVSSMRPVLSWLVLFDEEIRNRVCKVEPEVLFEGGDPSQLPQSVRADVLQNVCKKIDAQTTGHSVSGYSAVKLFANADIAADVKKLIKKYKNNSEITSFLMRMIWQGQISSALPEAKLFASDDKVEKYTRIAAFRAVKEIGTDHDFQEVLGSLLSQKDNLDRRLLAEVIDLLDGSVAAIGWVFEALDKANEKKQYSTDGLSFSLVNFADRLNEDETVLFIKKVHEYLEKKPVIERRFCEVSKRFGWLMNSGARAVEKLILIKNQNALNDDSLSILAKLVPFKDYAEFQDRSLKNDISELANDWPDLKHAIFWKDVEVTRKNLFFKKGERLTYSWQAFTMNSHWWFEGKDFDRIASQISAKEFLDDKLVALSLAFRIYEDNENNEKPSEYIDQLKLAVSGQPELEERIALLINPPEPSAQQKKMQKREEKWAREDQKRKNKKLKNKVKSLKYLQDNVNDLKDKDLLKDAFGKGVCLNAQRYLLNRMRELKDNSSSWTQANWKDLIPDFGQEIAQSFRDGLLLSWRFYKPALRSENDEEDGTPSAIIFGLSGLEIESREVENWPENISENDAELACRYAFQELNGFPSWFPKLYKSFPNTVGSLILREIDWELENSQDGKEKHYIVDKVSWGEEPLWDSLSEAILDRLQTEPLSLKYLSHLLKMVQNGSTISNEDLSKIAETKCKKLNDLQHVAQWFAVWIGVDPADAINHLTQRLDGLKDSAESLQLAMDVIVNLVGDRRTGSHARSAYQAPKHLKELYLLMHKYIKVREDTDRAGKGAYSPDTRDHAQEARNGLFSILTDIAGKETYLALSELSQIHPEESFRAWMLQNAKQRAEQDADMVAWDEGKFIEYKISQESTPSNHSELFDLVNQRFEDLKHSLEEGDTSVAPILIDVKKETKVRNFIGGWLRDNSSGRYSIPQEEELADAKKPDLRIHGVGFDAPVPAELKLADNWSAADLLERLENQLCGDYLRDNRSNKGIFLLVYRGDKAFWKIPDGNQKASFYELLDVLKKRWEQISPNFPNVDEVKIIGIDLTKRMKSESKK